MRTFKIGLVFSSALLAAMIVVQVGFATTSTAAVNTLRPSAPIDVHAHAGPTSVVVTFARPRSSGRSRITKYAVWPFPSSDQYFCESTRCVITGLTSGVATYFKVRAINRYGPGPFSARSNTVTLEAPPVPMNTVTFNANGGLGTMDNESADSGVSTDLTLNTFTFPGYAFVDWNTAANGSGASYPNGSSYSFSASITLYAQWSTTTVTVTFNANGGTGTMPNEVASYGVSADLTLNAFLNVGHSFVGWNTAANGSGVQYVDGSTYAFKQSITLYAQWTVAVPEGIFPGTVSTNWSGYELDSSTTIFTAISSEWTVPVLNCTNTPNGDSSTWVGLGGVTWSDGSSSGSLLQTGTEDDCVDGVQTDSGWFEIFPSTPNHEESFTNFPVSPGDTMWADVYEQTSTGLWFTTLKDLNTGLEGVFEVGNAWDVESIATNTVVGSVQGTATGTSYSGAYSAEWIVEDTTDSDSGTPNPLADFNSVTLYNLGLGAPSGSWTVPPYSDAIEMTSFDNTVMALPSPILGSGSATTFTVYFESTG